MERTGAIRAAKSSSADGYQAKAAALSRQIVSLEQERELKLREYQNKYEQSLLYVTTLEADLVQQIAQADIAAYQERRTDTLNARGLKSLSDLEAKRLKTQEARAKQIAIENKLEQGCPEMKHTEHQDDVYLVVAPDQTEEVLEHITEIWEE